MKNNAAADKFRDEGNAFFSQVNFYEALISYNKSLCNAEPQSVQLGLAYSNRSAVYLNLKEFDKCLTNIQLARDNNYPHEKKLEAREEKCKEKMKAHQPDTTNDPWTYFKLSYPPNEKIPFMAECLELRTDEKYGRHIITNRDLQPGDVIAVEGTILPIVTKSGLYTRCTFCFSSNMLNLIPCDCSSAMFCNQECLTKGRDRFHGALCEKIDSGYKRVDEGQMKISTSISRGLLESLHIVKRSENLQDLTNLNERFTIFDYDLRNQQDDPDIDFKYLSIVDGLGIYFASRYTEDHIAALGMISYDCVEKYLPPLTPEAEEMLVEYSTNLAMITLEYWYEQIEGAVILPIRSLYNHSCDANTVVFPIDNKMVHVVMKPIGKGEQLFISYEHVRFYSESDRVKRQDVLMKHFNFKCTCSACLNDYSMMSLPQYDPTFRFPGSEVPSTIHGVMKEVQQRFKYIKKNFNNYPTYEVAATGAIIQVFFAEISVKSQSLWPFEMTN